MEYVIGILLLVSFVGLAVYAVRGGNLMMGMLIMGIIWTVLPLIGNTFATNPEFIAAYPGITDISFVDAITKVFQPVRKDGEVFLSMLCLVHGLVVYCFRQELQMH